MKSITGINQKETLELNELLSQHKDGETVRVNGAVHAIRKGLLAPDVMEMIRRDHVWTKNFYEALA